MDGLMTLTKLLNTHLPKNYFTSKRNNKAGVLYENIINGNITCNQTAKQLLYKNSGNVTSSFNTLKSRYYSKILSEIAKINFGDSNLNTKKKIELQILDYLKIYSILDTDFSIAERAKFLETLLKRCLKIGDVELVLMVLQHCFINSSWLRDKRKIRYYAKLLDDYKSYYDHKIIAIKANSYLSNFMVTRKYNKSIPLNISMIKEVFDIKDSKTTDYNTKFFIYSSIYYFYFITYEIEEIISICNQALKYFKQRLNLNKYGYYSFAIKYSYILMFKKNFREAQNFFDFMLDSTISRKQSIFLNINIYAIKNLIYLSRYKEATLRLIDVTRHKDYEKIKTPFFTEIYRIKEAYLNVLYKMKKFELEDDTVLKKKPFRINKFLNEVPIYSKDKRGSNISILIIHVFYLFINKKYDLILNRLESLKAYSHRYLRNDDSLRSNAFIKILLQLPGANYHPVALERHASKYYKKMINAPLHLAARHIEVEVIPYEKQYELLTDLLKMRLNKQI